MKIDYDLFPIFRTLDEKSLKVIKSNVQLTKYAEGSIIHFEGDKCEYLEMVQYGNIHIEQIDVEGNTQLVRDYGTGSIFGLNILFSTEPNYLMHVIATKETMILSIHQKEINKLIVTNEQFRHTFIRLLSDNSKMLGVKIMTQFRVTLREKIMEYIKYQMIEQQSDIVVFTKTKTALAKMFGVERTSLSRALQKMKNEGIVNYNRTSISLVK